MEEAVVTKVWYDGGSTVGLKVLLPGKWLARTRYVHVASDRGVTYNGTKYTDARLLVTALVNTGTRQLKVRLSPDATGTAFDAEFMETN